MDLPRPEGGSRIALEETSLADAIILQLVERVLDSGCTPEEACADSPHLIAEVRDALRRLSWVDAQIDALFHGTEGAGVDGAEPGRARDDLPRVPGHELLSVLGRGGMGVVYRARHLGLSRIVALKTLLGGPETDRSVLKRFQREAEAVAALRHPNIVQVYEVGEHDGLPFFTMELVEGGSLREKVRERPLAARQAASLVATLAAAMEVAHACGIVHRDLKPANVLLTADGVPKIADFGLARRIQGESLLTLPEALLGTPSYMAPEQAAGGARAVGPPADVYALGAILYHALTARPPFQGEVAALTLRRVLEDEPVPPSRLNARVPRDLETICLKSLAKDPPRRYGSAAELAADLQRFLRGEPIRARPVGALERAGKWTRRRPAQAALAAGSALAVLALAGAALWLRHERHALERAAREDLLQVDRAAAAGNWPAARTALETARARLADGGSAELREQVAEGGRELELVDRLEEIRLRRADVAYRSRKRPDNSAAAAGYQGAFADLGLADVPGRPAEAAARIRSSRIREVLVSALDTWAACAADDAPRRDGLLEAARLADPDPTGWRDRVRDPARWGDPKALAELMSAAPASGASVALLLALAEHVVLAGGDAIPFLQRVQQQYPDDFWANFTLGKRLAERGDVEAIRFFHGAVALRPDDAVACGTLGIVMADPRQVEEALAMLRRSSPGPEGIPDRCLLTGYLAELGRLEECIAEARAILLLDPDCYDALLRLAYALHGSGRLEQASEAYRRAIAIDPRAPAHESLGQVLADLGRPDEALACYREAVGAGPERTSARSELIKALISGGRIAEACTEARLYLDSRPAGDSARQHAKGLVDRCDVLREIEANLPAVLDGSMIPSSGARCLVFADFFRGREDYARATRYYADAFDSGSRFLQSGDRRTLEAACCAALAGTGEPAAAGAATDEQRAQWRALALEWLRGELVNLDVTLAAGTARVRSDVQWCVMRLETNPSLAGVRDAEPLERLPEEERARWRALWSDAAALAERAKARP